MPPRLIVKFSLPGSATHHTPLKMASATVTDTSPLKELQAALDAYM